MLRFTFGLAILIFTVIVGSYKYLDNEALIAAKERGLQEAENKRERYKRIDRRSKQVSQFSIPRGEDKKNTIERLLKIGEPGLKFSFIGQAQRETAHLGIIRHTFKIEGNVTFQKALSVLNDVHQRPGFIVHGICFDCGFRREKKDPKKHFVKMEGYLYAYDPNIL